MPCHGQAGGHEQQKMLHQWTPKANLEKRPLCQWFSTHLPNVYHPHQTITTGKEEHPALQPRHRSDGSGAFPARTHRRRPSANEIVGAQAPDKYVPACTASRNECSLRINGEGSGMTVHWYRKYVGCTICEVFLHGRSVVK